jgi:hypothetical protein
MLKPAFYKVKNNKNASIFLFCGKCRRSRQRVGLHNTPVFATFVIGMRNRWRLPPDFFREKTQFLLL